MGNIIEGPKFPLPIRAAAIIETAQGILLVHDWQDHFRKATLKLLSDDLNRYIRRNKLPEAERKLAAMRIACQGRFSLPGGGIDLKDYIDAGAEQLLGLPYAPRSPKEKKLFAQVVIKAAIREIKEETGTTVDSSQIAKVVEIQGKTRHHIILLMRIDGELRLPKPEEGKEPEITGYGFLNRSNYIAMAHWFYQSHVKTIHSRYFQDQSDRSERSSSFMSRVRVPLEYMEQWHKNLQAGYDNRPTKYQRKHQPPSELKSSPNFEIFDKEGKVHNPYHPRSLTKASRARYIPREITPWEKSPSDNTPIPPSTRTPLSPRTSPAKAVHPFNRDEEQKD